MCRSGVLAYPCDTISFTEGFGTTILQSYAAGMLPITTDTDAFGEVYGSDSDAIPLVGYDNEPNPLVPRSRIADDFADRVVGAVHIMASLTRPGWAFGGPGSQQALLNRYSWEMVGGLWDEVLQGKHVFWPEKEAA